MFPGMDPRAMRAAMKKMGMKQEEIPAEEVVIRTAERDIVIRSPSVQKVEMMGQISFQISGEETERPRRVDIREDDVAAVSAQAGVAPEAARKALEEHRGDLAAAILSLQEQ